MFFPVENRCWSNWINNDNPQTGSGDFESTAGVCSNPSNYDCQAVGGFSLKNVDLDKDTKCTAQGISCRNSAQWKCPDFKVRVVCPCSGTYKWLLFSGNMARNVFLC